MKARSGVRAILRTIATAGLLWCAGGATVSSGMTANSSAQTAALGAVVSPPAAVQATSYPAWRASMPALTWKAVSGSKMADVNPAFDAAVNPFGAGIDSPWRGSNGQAAVIDAWGSGVWSEDQLAFWVPIGGGHGNYAGNEPYKMSVNVASPLWTRPRNPSGAIGNTINLNDGQESTGTYVGDGRPRSPHAYNNVAYAPGVGPVIARIAAPYSQSNISTGKVFRLHPSTGESTLVFDFQNAASCGFPGGWPGNTGPGGHVNAAACYVPPRGGNPGRIYSAGTGNNTWLVYCEPTNTPGTWTGGHAGSATAYYHDSFHGIIYSAVHDKLIMLGGGNGWPLTMTLIDIDTNAHAVQTLSGSFAPGFDTTEMVGFDWCADRAQILLWNQLSNPGQLSTLTPVGDGLTSWTRGTLSPDAANTVLPPNRAPQHRGTFGNWRYSQSLGGFLLVTSTSEPTYFFSTRSTTAPTAPTVTTQPQNQTVTAGQTATFSVTASGAMPLSHQWQKNGTDIPGATGASYVTPATTLADSGATFRVIVTNSVGNVTSNPATLTVTAAPAAPTITTQPVSQTVTTGQTATFSVVAAGTVPLTYQWQKNGVNIAGATSASYTTPATVAADNGAAYRAIVTNASGTATSNAATLTVNGVAADTDGDGLPDAWETQQFGNLNQGAGGDPDGDGATNLQEYLAGTDPMNPASGTPVTATSGRDKADGNKCFGSIAAGQGLSIWTLALAIFMAALGFRPRWTLRRGRNH